ncbi:MAG TPA: hypothetical protein PK812_08030 [Beijerinckiaceae bacterium]|nr:hypothetical protein [Beijerinckiaceae bacterium]
MDTPTLSYAYRSRPFAAETRLELGRKELIAWQAGQQYVYPYHAIATIRLFFAPRGIDMSGYRAKIYSRDGKTISLEDRTFRGMVQVERQGQAYRAFITALCRRAATENPQVLLHSGRNPFMLALSGMLGMATTGTLAFLGGRAALQGQWLLAAAIIGFAGLFGFWSWRYVVNNRPRRFVAAAIPEAVLPQDRPRPA